jgi:hypothetical protein
VTRTGIATALAAVSAATLTLTAIPGAAQAAAVDRESLSPEAWTDCPQTYFCVWVDGNYQGPRGQFQDSNPSWGSFYQSACRSGTWSDCASSGFNNGTSGMGVVVWDESGYYGHSRCLPKGWRHPYFTQVYWGDGSANINDKISSNEWSWNCHY